MKNIITLLLLTAWIAVEAQLLEVKYGTLSPEEIAMTNYGKNKNAKAIVLFDKGNTYFYETDAGYDVKFTRHKRIKIFDKTAVEHTEIEIPFYQDGYGKNELIKSIEAITYNIKNGKIVSKVVSPKSIYEEKINSKWNIKKFVFPDVQNGAILEYRYVLHSPFKFKLPEWKFQSTIPTLYSEYKVSMIPFYEYVYLVQGVSKFDYQDSSKGKDKRRWGTLEFKDYIHTYVIKDIPAFENESFITSVDDYIVKLDLQLAIINHPNGGKEEVISTWLNLNKKLLNHEFFGKYVNKSENIAKKILEQELNLDGMDDLKKSKTIIEYVKNNFEWNNNHSKYASNSAKKFYSSKVGNSASINLFLIGMLKAADIDVIPVILSTRGNGKIKADYPFDHFTNYVLAFVNVDQPFLADGSDHFTPFNRLPSKCYNENGLLVTKDQNEKWISLKNNIPSVENYSFQLKLDPESLDLNTTVSIQNTEYESFYKRDKFKNKNAKIEEYYSDKIGDISKSKTVGYEKTNKPYSIFFNSTFETEKIGNTVIIPPFLKTPISENILTQPSRSYPIDFIYPWSSNFDSKVEIPAGFSAVSIPEGFSINNNLVDINLSYEFADNVLISKGKYQFKKAVYSPNEYAKIRSYFKKIIEKFNQILVIEGQL